MAESTTTKNLGLPRVMGNDLVSRDSINNALEKIDEQAIAKSHQDTKAHFEMWQKNTAYGKKSAVRTQNCPNWGVYICITAGISGATEPVAYGEGDVVADGSCVWQLTSIAGTGYCTKQQAIAYAIALG